MAVRNWCCRIGRRAAFIAAACMVISAQGVALSVMDTPAPRGGVKVIVLDPGHGGGNLGVTGAEDAAEKQLMLRLARKISERLASEFTVHLTRTGDYDLSLKDRTSIANHHGADLFISLHAGGSSSSGASGWTVYHDRRKAVSRFGRETGQAPFLWDQVQQRHIPSSVMLAEMIAKRLEVNAAREQTVDVMEAPLAVLSGADMPAVVVEAGCLTHLPTAQAFAAEEFIGGVADDIAMGVFDFFAR
ncbi:MAG: N-acetylmuramoyl-L-alanine amidase family protein [Thermodesulfobacteriota bacterium]